MLNKPELLSPAGNLEKLKVAITYGADAVYFSGYRFGLRSFAGNFDEDEIIKGVEYAHKKNKKAYITMNIYAHNEDFVGMEEYIRFLEDIEIDGLIISDPGVLYLAQNITSKIPIHLSTQANTTNWQSANFWYKQGIERIVLARELSLEEIAHIDKNTPKDLNLEAFVHGAMCISYSGRCLLSNVFTGRDANRGACTHPCRWKYSIVEEQRPGEYYPVFEDERGSYIMNSKDLVMIEHIPELINAGINSFKIEGRMKSSYYVAAITKAYREEIDSFCTNPDDYKFTSDTLNEIKKVSNRGFTKGFYFNKPDDNDHNYENSNYFRDYDFIGIVLDYDYKNKRIKVEQRNHFSVGESIEIMLPKSDNINYYVNEIFDEENVSISRAPHPQQIVYLPYHTPLEKYSILRREHV